jgi:hypothetical protein
MASCFIRGSQSYGNQKLRFAVISTKCLVFHSLLHPIARSCFIRGKAQTSDEEGTRSFPQVVDVSCLTRLCLVFHSPPGVFHSRFLVFHSRARLVSDCR